MNTFKSTLHWHRHFSLLLMFAGTASFAQEEAPTGTVEESIAKAIPVAAQKEETVAEDDDSPAPLPPLSHFAKLWTDSLFTTKAMPVVETAKGPNFTDMLSLSGTYEDNGKMTAILIDKSTSGVVQAFIGEDNEEGFRISKIEPGDSPERMRIQLQKGNQTGWVSFGEASSAGASEGAQVLVPGAAPGAQPNGPLASRPNAAIPRAEVVQPAPSVRNHFEPKPAEQVPSFVPAALPAIPDPGSTSLRGGMPQAPAALPGDPPLPPP